MTYAYQMGEADWAYENGTSRIMGMLSVLEREVGWEEAVECVEQFCRIKGIDPKRHKFWGFPD